MIIKNTENTVSTSILGCIINFYMLLKKPSGLVKIFTEELLKVSSTHHEICNSDQNYFFFFFNRFPARYKEEMMSK